MWPARKFYALLLLFGFLIDGCPVEFSKRVPHRCQFLTQGGVLSIGVGGLKCASLDSVVSDIFMSLFIKDQPRSTVCIYLSKSLAGSFFENLQSAIFLSRDFFPSN